MTEWQEVSLDLVAQINPTESLSKGTLAKKIAMNDLQPFTKRPTSFGVAPYNGGMKFKNGDTIVARITPCLENGKTAYIDLLDKNELAYGSTEYIVLREKLGVTDKQFLYYFSISPIFRDVAIASMTGSSGRQRVQTDVVKQHIFEMPSLEEQKSIALVLSSLDNKIDLLHRQNTTLERMAETLFRQWFVEEAQEDWKEVRLGDVVETTSGGTPSRSNMKFYENGIINWVKSKELSGSFILDSEEKITAEALKKSSAKLLSKNSILIAMYGATVGEYAIISKEMTCNQAVCALKPNEQYPYTFLFLYVRTYQDELINMAVGSAQQNISQFLIKQLPIPTCHEKISKFHKKTEPFFEKIKNNISQIQTLEKLRDNLLPKLISGEIRIG